MVIIARQKQRLPHDALIRPREAREALCVPGPKDVWKRTVDAAEVGDEFGLVADGGADGQI